MAMTSIIKKTTHTKNDIFRLVKDSTTHIKLTHTPIPAVIAIIVL
jgi:hypothetical protein